MVVYLSTTLNTGHAWGTGEETVILPVLPRDEEPEPTTQESMFSFVRLSDGGPARFDGPRSEVSILATLGQELFADGQGMHSSRIDWKILESHKAIRELIAELVPEYAGMKNLDESKQEFHVPGRAVEGYRFPTATGRAKFHAVSWPNPPALGERQLRLMTIRSEGQFNAVVYDEEDIYRRQERRDVILMNAEDIGRFGLEPNQRVKVQSLAGEMRYILVREYDIRPGNAAMYLEEVA
jgi:anaerobic selenocysteine-containing dehydrogenase